MSASGWEPRRTPPWTGWGALTVLAALLLSGLIYALPMLISDPVGASTLLYTVPVGLLAARFGWRAGGVAALLAFGATVLAGRGQQYGALLLGTRLIGFLVAGLGVGLAAEQLHGAVEERRKLQLTTRDAAARGQRAERVQLLIRELSRAATVQEVAAAFAGLGLSLLGASRGAVFVLDGTGEQLTMVSGTDHAGRLPGNWRSLRLAMPTLPTDVLRAGRPAFLADLGDIQAAYPGLLQSTAEDGTLAWAAAPLGDGDRLIGAVVAGFGAPQAFEAESREDFLAVAARVGEAVERAQLLQVAELERARAEASERRASLLAEVGSVLTAPLQSAERMQRLVRLLVPDFADAATVEAVPGAAPGAEPGADPGAGLELLAAAHADPALIPALERIRRRQGRAEPDGWGLAAALRRGQPELRRVWPAVPEAAGVTAELDAAGGTADGGGTAELDAAAGDGSAPDDGAEFGSGPDGGSELDSDQDGGQLPAGLQPGSSIAVPLVARGTVIAGILLLNGRTRRGFDAADLALARSIADKAALALDNAQLYERQREVVSRLQHALLPGALPRINGVEAVARYRPATEVLDVGGDWYDLIELPGQRVGIVLGDVVGHGVAAAATMGQLRSAVAAIAPYCSGPGDLLQRLDRFAATVAGAAIATVAYADFEPATGVLRYACAGHPPPLLIDDRGQVRFLTGGRGIPLGMDVGHPWVHEETSIGPRGTLICYSDGLVERRGQDIDIRLKALATNAAELAARPLPQLCDELLGRMTGTEPLRDDIAILCLALQHRAGRALRYSVPARPSELAHLRAALQAWARGVGLPQAGIVDLTLAVSEAASNAVEHAYLDDPEGTGTIELRADVGLDGMMQIEVADRGRWREQHEPRAHRGHGLTLIRATMSSVHIETGDGRTAVIMTMPLPGSEPART